MTKDREEDSGLHDIRSLASSTKARLSSRRSTQNPVMSEDDILASSSAGWKAVALPEPAKMVSLPELAELPSAKEVKELADKATRKSKAEEKGDRQAAKAAASAAPAVATEAAGSSIPSIGSRIAAKQQGGGKGKVIAVVGLGLAAAAGVTFFVMNNKKDGAEGTAADRQVAAATPPADYQSTAKMLPPPPPPAPEPVAAAAGSAAPAEPPPAQIAASEEPAKPAAPAKTEKAAKPAHKVEIKDDSMTKRAEAEKVKAPEKKEEVKKNEGGEGEPSFDALLKEAGVSDMKKEAKPKLDKKSLSGGDIKTGMGSVAGKAQACYAGTQGTAQVKLTVTPDGKVSKVTVTGVFAGTPVASCVEAAVKSAQFPAWEGGPQSFGYSYLLSE
ncbi:MAG: hypothetical protein JNL83_16060 [Myxococcales bacterium]|nr:hypothetical protein [Myxococcales bacterium]